MKTNASRAAVFLDRDGVLNEALVRDGRPVPPSTIEEFVLTQGAAGACARLQRMGFALVVVTNQPDIARGTQDIAVVEAMHDVLRARIPLDAIYICPHDDEDRCTCRKPLPGMLLSASRELGLDLAASYMVGDRWRDVEAGKRAGCRTIHVDRTYDEPRPAQADAVVLNLPAAACWIEALILGGKEAQLPDSPVFNIKVFADGADLDSIIELSKEPFIAGFTTNPTLMRKAGVVEYEVFARDVMGYVGDRAVSFEVISDDFEEMGRQARRISSWGSNVYVKIPVTNTAGESASDLIQELSDDGVRLNVTAILSLRQVARVIEALRGSPGAIVSVFAGRIADAGEDPVPLMAAAANQLAGLPSVELLWASPREILNLRQAEAVGCDIITMTHDLLKKVSGLGRDLEAVSLDTVKMFYNDAKNAGYKL